MDMFKTIDRLQSKCSDVRPLLRYEKLLHRKRGRRRDKGDAFTEGVRNRSSKQGSKGVGGTEINYNLALCLDMFRLVG